MTTREPLIIGPFSKGINHFDDDSAIQDTEAVEALNFDPGLDGSLRSRPPFVDVGSPLTLGDAGHPRILGYYYDTSGNSYMIVGDGDSTTYSYRNGNWTVITSTFSATDMQQFNGQAWLLPPVGSGADGGYWTPGGGFTADSDMPEGTSIVSYKSRLWIAEGSGGSTPYRIRYSKVMGQPDFWDSAGFFDVAAGDGQAVVKIVSYFDSMLIFRTQSIWSYQYGLDPATAITGVLVPGIGLANKHSLVSYENYLYFMFDERAYEFINNKAAQLNIKVPFRTLSPGGTAHPYSVSVFSNRIIFSFYETLYVFSLRTRTWTTWKSDDWGPIGQIVSSFDGAEADEALVIPSGDVPTSLDDREVPLLRIRDRFTSDTENFQCVLQTKNYSFDVPGSFKILFWWGVDAIFRTNVLGQVNPVVFNLSSTWGQLLGEEVSWQRVRAGTWAHPYLTDSSVSDSVSIEGSGPARKFVRFLKKLRFRQISFRVVFQVDGSTATSPVQIFTLSAYMAEKQTVSKKIS